MLLAWLTIAIVATAIVVAVLMTVALTVLALLLFLALLTVLLLSVLALLAVLLQSVLVLLLVCLIVCVLAVTILVIFFFFFFDLSKRLKSDSLSKSIGLEDSLIFPFSNRLRGFSPFRFISMISLARAAVIVSRFEARFLSEE